MIQIEGLEKSYRKKAVLRQVAFSAKPGTVTVIAGDNGAGKSTLLQIMAGMMRADAGSIRYFGQEMGRKRKLYAKYCGYLAQTNGLLEALTVQDNLCLWTGRKEVPDNGILELLGLEDLLRCPICELSGGMKRRAAIACAAANFPPILLMDEPTAALDKNYRESIHRFMKEYAKKNGTLVVVSHDEEEYGMADQMLFLRDGKILQ